MSEIVMLLKKDYEVGLLANINSGCKSEMRNHDSGEAVDHLAQPVTCSPRADGRSK